jgi:hypothetical protein
MHATMILAILATGQWGTGVTAWIPQQPQQMVYFVQAPPPPPLVFYRLATPPPIVIQQAPAPAPVQQAPAPMMQSIAPLPRAGMVPVTGLRWGFFGQRLIPTEVLVPAVQLP